MSERPLVSINIVTYNHEPYIAQAIEGALMQKTNFPYEVLIGEDDSSDGTREICKQYAKKYPDKIRLFLNDRKNVIYIQGQATGRWNFVNLLKNAKGKYIALCEGDDYWTDPLKLQKQVDVLERHPECAICFHSATQIFEYEETKPIKDFPPGRKKIYGMEDLLERNFIVTCSCMFRKGLFGPFPEWFYRMPMGDWPLHILNAQQGNIGYIDEDMSAYRLHRGSYWFSRGKIENYINEIRAYTILADHLNKKHSKLIKSGISYRHYYLSKLYKEKKEYISAFLSIVKCLAIYPFRPAVSYWNLLRKFLFRCLSHY